ncbi:MAG: hypothetical protein GY863_08795, partial [bacterium]|nr:hypothetical protein [bacterium]
YPVKYEYFRIVHAVIIIGVLFFIWTLLPENGGILWEFGLLLLYPCLIFITGFFDTREKEKMRQVLKSVFK